MLECLMGDPASLLRLRDHLMPGPGVCPSAAAPLDNALAAALRRVNGGGAAPGDLASMRFSAKLFHIAPDRLPPHVAEQLAVWLGGPASRVEGAIRPGCVFLTVQLTMREPLYSRALDRGAPSLAAFLAGCSAAERLVGSWSNTPIVFQLNDTLAISPGDGVVQAVSPFAVAGRMPVLEGLSSHVVIADAGAPARVTLFGSGLLAEGATVLARRGSAQFELAPLPGSTPVAAAVRLPAELADMLPRDAPAILWLEVAMGGVLSAAQPVLVAPSVPYAEAALARLARLGPAPSAAALASFFGTLASALPRPPNPAEVSRFEGICKVEEGLGMLAPYPFAQPLPFCLPPGTADGVPAAAAYGTSLWPMCCGKAPPTATTSAGCNPLDESLNPFDDEMLPFLDSDLEQLRMLREQA